LLRDFDRRLTDEETLRKTIFGQRALINAVQLSKLWKRSPKRVLCERKYQHWILLLEQKTEIEHSCRDIPISTHQQLKYHTFIQVSMKGISTWRKRDIL